MKYLYLLLFVFVLPFAANAQFSEDFEGVATTEGYGDIPTELGYAIYDLDSNSVGSNVAYIDEAWIIETLGDGNQVAVSTSFYDPAGEANDWLVTPLIPVPAENPALIFEAMSFHDVFQDDYEVLISTTGNTPSDFTTVLYESTGAPTSLKAVTVFLQDFAGESVYVAFRNVGQNELKLGIDNIKVFSVPNNEVEVVSLMLNGYSLINTDNTLKAIIRNKGSNVIDSLKFSWTFGTNSYEQVFTNLNLATYIKDTVVFDVPVNYPDAVRITVAATAVQVNGEADPLPSNNEASTKMRLLSQMATRHVVMEEGTGTWCGFCPRGVVAMEYMYEHKSTYPNFIGIAVHTANGSGRADPMDMAEYADNMNLSGFPGSNVDRIVFDKGVSTSAWVTAYNVRKDIVVAADVEVVTSYDGSSRDITATVGAKFYTKLTALDYRLTLIIVEDAVTAKPGEATYYQHNYFSDNFDVENNYPAMGGYEDLPEWVAMSFDRVAIAVLGGYNGVQNSVPTSVVAGDNPTHTFTYTLPEHSDPNEISLVGMLIDQNTGRIVNAINVDLGSNLGVKVHNPITVKDIKVFPNPTSEVLHVSFGMLKPSNVRLNVYTMTGKLVKSQDYKNISGDQTVQINLSSLSTGEYLVSLLTNQGSVAKTIIVE